MRIVCPICSAAYEVRDSLLSPARAVRCARCGEEWVPLAASPPPPPGPGPAPEPAEEPSEPPPQREPIHAPPSLTAMERLASRPAAVPRPSSTLRVAWAASLLVLALFCGGILLWRADVMRAWPPSIRLYDALGLAAATGPMH